VTRFWTNDRARRTGFLLTVTAILIGAVLSRAQDRRTPATADSASIPEIDYERDVRPILSRCFGCHGPKQAQSGLRLDLRQNALRGGDYGVVIVPGRSAESKLIMRVTGSTAGLQMPPTGPLAEHEIEILRAWIDQGAEMPGRAIEIAPAASETPASVRRFLDAVVSDDLAAVGRLLAEDPGLARSADGFGSTALMHAAASGSIAVMRTLIDAGAELGAANSRLATALHWAQPDAAKVALLLSKGAAVDPKTVEGRTPLYVAASLAAGTPSLRLLLDAGANPNAETLVGTTPLFPAVNSSAEMTKLLLDKGADPNHATKSGVTPILFTRDAAVVELLIARGADVRARSKVGETALMDVATRGDEAAAKLLLAKGADVNAKDHRGYTALMFAAQYDGDAVELVRLLLTHGADVTPIAEGQTALSLAAKRGETGVTKLLRAAAPSSGSGPRADDPLSSVALRRSAERGLDLLIKTSPTFIKKGGCNSCHNQMLPAAAQAFARTHGIVSEPTVAQLPADVSEATMERYAEYSVAGGAGINTLTFELFAANLTGTPIDERIRAQIRYIKTQQQPEGHWRGGSGVLTNNGQQALSRPAAARPPLNFDAYSSTAYMIRALRSYGRPDDDADTRERIQRASKWLLNVKASRTQEHAFRVLGLTWASADRRSIDAAAQALQSLQRTDGGFSQLPTLPSDAYATGLALFALHEAGMPPAHPVYQAGLKFLLNTQADDGTWHVKSRSLEFQPYFESGYPYGHDQWISAAGTAYAVFAIAAGVPPQTPRRYE
jgi:ankyrin repeat protein